MQTFFYSRCGVHDACLHLNRRMEEIGTLEEIGDDSNDRSVQARGLLHQVKSFPFLLSLVLFNKIFGMTNNQSNLLQAEQLSYATAASCIKASKSTLSDLRSVEMWEKCGMKH